MVVELDLDELTLEVGLDNRVLDDVDGAIDELFVGEGDEVSILDVEVTNEALEP